MLSTDDICLVRPRPNNGIDDDLNGVIDDVKGAVMTDIPRGDPRPNPYTNKFIWSHGTSCATIAVGATTGAWGIAPGCRLLPVAVVGPEEGTGEIPFPILTDRYPRALDYVLACGARVSSWSIATTTMPTAFKDLCERATEMNHVLVCAAGNDNINVDSGLAEPVCWSQDYDCIIGVAATDNHDCLALYNAAATSGSNYGPSTVLIGAPGWWNVSSRKTHPIGVPFQWFEGTSAATPHVAGAVGLLLSVHPEYTCADVKAKLVQYGRSTSGLQGTTISGKSLDVGALINH